MSKKIAFAAALAVAALSGAVRAQSPGDVAYCNSLADTYVRYVGHDESSPSRMNRSGTTDGAVAVAECRQGKTAGAIPVLERELTRSRITLPGRG